MGLIVNNYMTAWGIAVPAYISVGRSDLNLISAFMSTRDENGRIPENAPNVWTFSCTAYVYKDKAAKNANPENYIDRKGLLIHINSADLAQKGIFGVMYEELAKMYPDGIRD